MNSRHPATPPVASGQPTDEQICIYIADLCGELRHLARRPQFRTISYLLDMARVESERMARALRAEPH